MSRPLPRIVPRRCGGTLLRLPLLAATLLAIAAAAISARAAEHPIAPGQSAVGQLVAYAVQQGDMLADIARKFDVGYNELLAANPGVDPWVPEPGIQIVIPKLHILPNAPHRGIVINLAQWRLFYFPPGGNTVQTYPLGVGAIGHKTPLGATTIVHKQPNPAWYPPPSIRAERPELPGVVPPGPDNPLGAYALRLGWPRYLIHGTNKPDGVGSNVSHGCIRLYPEDIETLFNAVAVGTPVRTVNQTATAGWLGDELYLQVYPSKTQADQIEFEQPVTPSPAKGVDGVVKAAAGEFAQYVDWSAVRMAADERSGLAVRVGYRPPGAMVSTPEPGVGVGMGLRHAGPEPLWQTPASRDAGLQEGAGADASLPKPASRDPALREQAEAELTPPKPDSRDPALPGGASRRRPTDMADMADRAEASQQAFAPDRAGFEGSALAGMPWLDGTLTPPAPDPAQDASFPVVGRPTLPQDWTTGR